MYLNSKDEETKEKDVRKTSVSSTHLLQLFKPTFV